MKHYYSKHKEEGAFGRNRISSLLRGLVAVLSLMTSSVICADARTLQSEADLAEVSANSQTKPSQVVPITLKVYFRQNIEILEPSFRDNAWRLEDFVTTIRNSISDSTYAIQEIVITSGASPEGPFDHNIDLSRNRGRALQEYLGQALGVDEPTFTINALGEDWEGFRRLVMQYKVPNRDKVLRIIDSYLAAPVKNQALSASCKTAIGNIDGGKTNDYIYANIYPELRSASNSVVCYLRPVEKVVRNVVYQDVIPVSAPVRDTLYIREDHYYYNKDTVFANIVHPVTVGKSKARRDSIRRWMQPEDFDRRLVMAVRSNLLLPLMNVGVEFPLGNRLSVGLDHYYPWLWRNTSVNEYCYELMFESAELRYWFGRHHKSGSEGVRNRLLGHSIGLFGAVGYYDYEHDWSGRQGEFWGAGIDYMLAVPVFRKRWHLEFELGFGYIYDDNQAYDVFEEGGKLFRRNNNGHKEMTYLGPLKAGITLVCPICSKKKLTVPVKKKDND